MQRDPNKTVSARGELVDFELLRIKQEMSTTPTVIKREPRRGRRKKLSTRVSKAVAPSTTEAAPEPVVDIVQAAPKIVRKRKDS